MSYVQANRVHNPPGSSHTKHSYASHICAEHTPLVPCFFNPDLLKAGIHACQRRDYSGYPAKVCASLQHRDLNIVNEVYPGASRALTAVYELPLIANLTQASGRKRKVLGTVFLSLLSAWEPAIKLNLSWLPWSAVYLAS